MKKILAVFLFVYLLSILPAFCDDLGLGDYTQSIENAWYGQKPITDEQFEKTVKGLQDKKNSKKIKKQKKQGQSLYKEEQDVDPFSQTMNEMPLLLLPVNLLNADESEIPVGHYSVVGKKVKNKVYLEFWQAHLKVATLEAVETNNDFGEKDINFVKVLPYDESKVKLIYGSIDFNAYTLVPIKTGIQNQ